MLCFLTVLNHVQQTFGSPLLSLKYLTQPLHLRHYLPHQELTFSCVILLMLRLNSLELIPLAVILHAIVAPQIV